MRPKCDPYMGNPETTTEVVGINRVVGFSLGNAQGERRERLESHPSGLM